MECNPACDHFLSIMLCMQPRLVGSLVTAMLEFSAKTTGAPVSHIELSNGTSWYNSGYMA